MMPVDAVFEVGFVSDLHVFKARHVQIFQERGERKGPHLQGEPPAAVEDQFPEHLEQCPNNPTDWGLHGHLLCNAQPGRDGRSVRLVRGKCQ